MDDVKRKRGTKVPRTGQRKKSERIPGARNEIYTSQIESVKFTQATTTMFQTNYFGNQII